MQCVFFIRILKIKATTISIALSILCVLLLTNCSKDPNQTETAEVIEHTVGAFTDDFTFTISPKPIQQHRYR
ncbi:MAG TPA: hypothetical protein ENH87_01325 [Pricia antarctica]|uniref:Uncharacterized protein n=1 Tax=Pricia antarctica TaxID=641691 RepID=A0A831QMC1_9FLAO|nr:hypothetical protein [Pricia antarctica]